MNRISYTYKINTCPKCGGKGILDQYRHIAGGVCFHCNGSGEVRGELVEHMMTMAEMEIALANNGIIFDKFDNGCGDDWEAALFTDPTADEIAYNAMRDTMIAASYSTL